jgi:hypothetical protein
MAITRTPIIDDDGSGTTGTAIDNAWKQQFYDQIDAVVGGVAPVYGSFTPADRSGAGLVFPTATGAFAQIGRLVHFQLQVVYPATSNTTPAAISLPRIVRGAGGAGAAQGYGILRVWYLTLASDAVSPYDPSTGGAIVNSQVSGANVVLSGAYLTD